MPPKNEKLFTAVESGDLEAVKTALAEGADINAKDTDNYTALNKAADEGNFDIVEFLVENGADINNKGGNDKTPLMNTIYPSTAKDDHNRILQYLIAKKADISDELLMRVKIKTDALKENAETGMVLPEAAEIWDRLLGYLKLARARQDFTILIKNLSHEETEIRRSAADIILAILFTFDDTDISEAVTALQKSLEDTDEDTRRLAASSLCINFVSKKDAAALKKLLHHKDVAVKKQATYAITQQIQLGKDVSIAKEMVEELLRDEDERVKELASEALGTMKAK
ncbi:MAG TPA: ankyrin repeat domain-containing protein [Patescibacteria group bacterium]|nr:ankyrin repeat domain-containing protein [Patescibacteria group bacterium]